jgi:hypothetical protein
MMRCHKCKDTGKVFARELSDMCFEDNFTRQFVPYLIACDCKEVKDETLVSDVADKDVQGYEGGHQL